MSYWEDTISEALDEFGITLTTEQLESVCESIQIAHDQYGMAHGHDCIPNPLEAEISRVRKSGKEDLEQQEKHQNARIEELEQTIRNLRSTVSRLASELSEARRNA